MLLHLTCVVLVTLMGCMDGAEVVDIVYPGEGDVVLGSTLCLMIQTKDFHVPKDGHVRLFHNGHFVMDLTSVGSTMVFNEMVEGRHTIEAVLVDRSNVELSTASAERSFEVETRIGVVEKLVKTLELPIHPDASGNYSECKGIQSKIVKQKTDHQHHAQTAEAVCLFSLEPVGGSSSIHPNRFLEYSKYFNHPIIQTPPSHIARSIKDSFEQKQCAAAAVVGHGFIVSSPYQALTMEHINRKVDDIIAITVEGSEETESLVIIRNSVRGLELLNEWNTQIMMQPSVQEMSLIVQLAAKAVHVLPRPVQIGPLLLVSRFIATERDLAIPMSSSPPLTSPLSTSTSAASRDDLPKRPEDDGFIEDAAAAAAEQQDRGWNVFLDAWGSTGANAPRLEQQWVNKQCTAAIVIPFRKRSPNLIRFASAFSKLKEQLSDRYMIIAVDQGDDHPFNRGALLNVGYLISEQFCEFALLHDVDFIPREEAIHFYQHPPDSDDPVHVLGRVLSAGGIVAVTHSAYEQTFGYPNSFWGWGYEDHEFQHRIEQMGLRVNRDHWPHGVFDYYGGYDILSQPSKIESERITVWEWNRSRFLVHRLLHELGESDGVTTTDFHLINPALPCGDHCLIFTVALNKS